MRACAVTSAADLDARVETHLPHWRALLQRLVRCPSTFEHEHDVVALVEEEIVRIGLTPVAVTFDPAALEKLPGSQPPYSAVPSRRNVVVRLPGRGGGRSLILNSHLDVVPAGADAEWTHPPFSGTIVEDVVYGRGSFDDKAGAAICLALLQLFSAGRERLRGDIVVHFVLEDEVTGNGSLLCLEAGHVGDAAIIVDGTRGTSGINQHAGNIRFGVGVAGRPASVSVSHMGTNAAEMLARLLLDLRQAVFDLNAGNGAPWTVFPSPNQMSTVALDCREAALTVPAQASAVCYATFTPPLNLAGFRALIEQVGAEFARRHQLPQEPAFAWDGFAAEPIASASGALERTLQSAAAKANREISFGPSTGTSDLRHFARRGIPCVLFGPGVGYNPHRADEHFHLDSLPQTVRILFHAINEWCA
jgi:acetylornithine deacetylase